MYKTRVIVAAMALLLLLLTPLLVSHDGQVQGQGKGGGTFQLAFLEQYRAQLVAGLRVARVQLEGLVKIGQRPLRVAVHPGPAAVDPAQLVGRLLAPARGAVLVGPGAVAILVQRPA